MTDAVEVEIGKALLARVAAFAAAQSPALSVSYPNIDFAVPTPTKTAQWLRASLLPADTVALGIPFGADNQHQGLLQVDVFQGQGIGELAPARVAASVIAYFARGTRLTSGGFVVQVLKSPYRSSLIKDDPWVFIPVRIPYNAFANPA